MARYSRRRGPAADTTIGVADTAIPGFDFTRTMDEGEVLILSRGRILNNTAGAVLAGVFAFIDGQPAPLIRPAQSIGAAERATITDIVFLSIAGGAHRFQLVGVGGAAANVFLEQNTAELTVIQLPLWDSDADIL